MERSMPPAAPPHQHWRRRHAGPTRPARALSVGAALVALATAAAACGSGRPAGSTSGPVSAQAAGAVRGATAKTLATGSATVALVVTSDVHAPGTSGGPPVGLKVLGNYDFHNQQGDGLLTITGVSGSSAQDVQAHLIFTNAALYLQATAMFAGLAGGKPWVEVTSSSFSQIFASAAPGAKGGPLGNLGAALIGQPLAAFDLFATQALTAAVAGHPTVAGQHTTEYAVTVDPAAAAGEATGEAKALFASLGSAPLHFDVWLDGSGRMVEVSALGAVKGDAKAASTAGQITGITVTLANLGAPVSVSVPPASQVAAPTTPGSGASSAG